jgi:hypothetical protein
MPIELLSEGNNNTWWFYNWEVFLGEAKHCQQHILLPSDKSSIGMHQEYESLATEMHYRSVSLRSFKSHVQILLYLNLVLIFVNTVKTWKFSSTRMNPV